MPSWKNNRQGRTLPLALAITFSVMLLACPQPCAFAENITVHKTTSGVEATPGTSIAIAHKAGHYTLDNPQIKSSFSSKIKCLDSYFNTSASYNTVLAKGAYFKAFWYTPSLGSEAEVTLSDDDYVFRFTLPEIGYDASGNSLDLQISVNNITIKNLKSTATSKYIDLFGIVDNTVKALAGSGYYCLSKNAGSAGQVSVRQKVSFKFLKHNTTTQTSGTVALGFADIDQVPSTGYAEAIRIVSGCSNTYLESDTKLSVSSVTYTNDKYTATAADSGTWKSGFSAVFGSSGSFYWYGSHACATSLMISFKAQTIACHWGTNSAADNSAGGSINFPSGTTYFGWKSSPTYSVAPATGYKVSNFTVNDVSQGVRTSYSFAPLTSHQYLRVYLSPISYKINYDPNGGSGSMSTQTLAYDQTNSLYPISFSKTGYTFSSWNTQAGGTGTTYQNAQSVKNLSAVDNSLITLYAQWKPITYQVSFNANTASGAMSTITCTYDTAQTLPQQSFTKTGYSFSSWNTKADGSGTSVSDAQSVKNLTSIQGATVTLYAQWKPITYHIDYQPNTGKGAMEQSICTYDRAQPLSSCNYTKLGYTFTNWATNKDGSGTSYSNEESICNLAATEDDIIKLYAQWKPNPYTVIFSANSGKGEMADQRMVYDRDAHLSNNTMTKLGYLFNGWNTLPNAEGDHFEDTQTVINLTSIPDGTVMLYAQWRPTHYTIQFDANGGSGAMDPIEAMYDTSTKLPSCTFAHSGKTFKGWSTKQNGALQYLDNAHVKNLSNQSDAIVTLYAIWEENTPVKYTYLINDPTHASLTQNEEEVLPLSGNPQGSAASVDNGYSFLGWKDVSGNDVSSDLRYVPTKGASGLFEPSTYQAYVEPISYTVHFDPNSGEGTMAPIDIRYDCSAVLPAHTFSKTGYIFNEWNTHPDGTGRTFKNNDDVVNLASDDGSTVTLYAQWIPITYFLHYDPNGGSGSLENQTLFYGNTDKIKDNNFSYEGYNFIGWNTRADGTGAPYQSNELVKDLSSRNNSIITLYAQWKPITYRIEYQSNGASGEMQPTHLIYDEAKHLSPLSYTFKGYSFLGWKSSKQSDLDLYPNESAVANLTNKDNDIVTLTAQWKINYCTVTFYDGFGSIIDACKVRYGARVNYPPNPTRDHYRFIGWDHDVSAITQDTDVVALWALDIGLKEQHPTKPMNDHGSLLIISRDSYPYRSALNRINTNHTASNSDDDLRFLRTGTNALTIIGLSIAGLLALGLFCSASIMSSNTLKKR